MKKDKPCMTYEEKYLISELEQTKNALAAAYSSFENVTDPDLIDSCIYQVIRYFSVEQIVYECTADNHSYKIINYKHHLPPVIA